LKDWSEQQCPSLRRRRLNAGGGILQSNQFGIDRAERVARKNTKEGLIMALTNVFHEAEAEVRALVKDAIDGALEEATARILDDVFSAIADIIKRLPEEWRTHFFATVTNSAQNSLSHFVRSFNPTMVRLLRNILILIVVDDIGFNPTMVRLLQQESKACLIPKGRFQSHNGAIAAIMTLPIPLAS